MGPWLLAGAIALATEDPPVFSAGVAVVRVEVLATRGGRPLRDLRVEDFELRDDGVVQQLEPTSEETAAIDVVLVLDTSESVVGPKLDALCGAAEAFLDRLGDSDRAALISFDEEVVLRAELSGDLRKVRGALGQRKRNGATALHDALYAALRLRGRDGRRLAVLVFSDGADNLSWLSADQLVGAARRSEAIVYAVVARDPGRRAPAILRRVAQATGGRQWTIRRVEDLRARFLDAFEDIRSRYVLRYELTGGTRPGWHAISVRLKGKQGDLLARPGYWR